MRELFYHRSKELSTTIREADKKVEAAEEAWQEQKRAYKKWYIEDNKNNADKVYVKVLYNEWKTADATFDALKDPANDAAQTALDAILEASNEYTHTIITKMFEAMDDANPWTKLNSAKKFNLAKDMHRYLVIADSELDMLTSRNLLSRARYEVIANLGYACTELGYDENEYDGDYVFVIQWRLDKQKEPIKSEDIKYLRGDMTQQELANRTGLSLNMIQKLESGERTVARMTAENLRLLVDALHGDIADFI